MKTAETPPEAAAIVAAGAAVSVGVSLPALMMAGRHGIGRKE